MDVNDLEDSYLDCIHRDAEPLERRDVTPYYGQVLALLNAHRGPRRTAQSPISSRRHRSDSTDP